MRMIWRNAYWKWIFSIYLGTDETIKSAKPRYKKIIGELPEFEKEDRFKINIVNCAMFSAVILSMKKKPTVEALTDYYDKAMTTHATRWFCRQAGKKKFSASDIREMKETAELKAADRNPYSWNMEFIDYDDVITQGSFLSKMYIKIFWRGTDDNEIVQDLIDTLNANLERCVLIGAGTLLMVL